MPVTINASTSSGLISSADTSGTIELQSNGTTRLTVASGGVTVTNLTATGTFGGGVITSGTAVASTSGTSIDFTGIPSWVKRITVMLNAVSTSGTSGIRVQLGYGATPTYFTTAYDANGVQVSTSTPSQTTGTEGFITGMSTSAAQSVWGSFVITQIETNRFTYTSTFAGNVNICGWAAGGRSMSGNTLTAIRVTTVGGTDTFDNGTINILYEG